MNTFQTILKQILVVGLCLIASTLAAQKPLNPTPPRAEPQSIVEVLNADIQEGINLSNMQLQSFSGNVIFRHQGVLMGTDKAIQNSTQNTVEAFGNIKINQGDTLTIVGDSLFYEGFGRIATIWGKNVVLRDKKVTLRTKKVIYNLATGIAYYPVKGEIIQDSSKLSSKTGHYNTTTKYFKYEGDVEVFNPKFLVCTEAMDYDTQTKRAIFRSFTTVSSENGTLTAEKGWYNINTRASYFEGRPAVHNEEYSLTGDTLSFDNSSDNGWAKGSIVFISKTDSLIVVGNEAERWGEKGVTKIMGETISKLYSTNSSTLLASDTLTVIEKPKSQTDSTVFTQKPKETSSKELSRNNIQLIIAQGQVQTYNKDLQSISDSMVYHATDSVMGYYNNPILWRNRNQIKADTIHAFLKNNQLFRMDLLRNCFIIDVDTLQNFNQIKGRNMHFYFADSSKLERIEINGNAESKYFVLDDKSKIVGLETAESSSMKFYFINEELQNIKFYTDVDAVLIPAKQITVSEAKFENFNYKIIEKPSAEKIYALRHGELLQKTTFDQQ